MASDTTTTDLRNALKARDRAAINTAAARLLEERTPLGEQWFSIALVLVRNGEVRLALAAAYRGVEESGASVSARFHLANVLATVGRHEQALEIVSAITPSHMNTLQRDHFLGTCAMETGDFATARAAFERVVALGPASAPTWLSLAALPPEDDDALLDRINSAASSVQKTSADYRAQWHYAKGTVLDRLSRCDEAFGEFAAGAEVIKPTRPYDPDTDHREAQTIASEFTASAINEVARGVRTDTGRPVFVMGLPRSGTTLIEQILTSHSQIGGGGEMPFGSILTREIGGNALARLESFTSKHGAEPLAQLYLHFGDEYFGHGQRFVDKSLGNSRALGMLASVLPEARVIWVRRDPLDCAWSCFRTYFTGGIEWSWSLSDIAAHFAAEDVLYAHWRDALGERLVTVSYEELARDPPTQVGRILAHIGLNPEPELEAPHQTRRAVTTASVAQVRQPVYRSSIGAAERYRSHLALFLDAYASVTSSAG